MLRPCRTLAQSAAPCYIVGMEKTLQTKQAAGGNDYFGEGSGYTAPHALYRFTTGGHDAREDRNTPWYASLAKAEQSWSRRHPDAA